MEIFMKLFRSAALMVTLLLLFQPVVNAQETILGLDDNNTIFVIQSDTPTIGDDFSVSGLAAGENLLAIDFRSGNAEVYAISSLNNVYILDQTDFAATLVGNFAGDPPGALSGNQFAFDFNPAFTPDAAANPIGSFARIISDTNTNRVINGNTGEYLVEGTDVFYAGGDINEDTNPNIQGIAYTNSDFQPDPGDTQQYGIDVAQNALVTIANNDGTLETVGGLGDVFGLGNDLGTDVGFDISGVSDVAYASFETGFLGRSELYTVDLTNGDTSRVNVDGVSGFASADNIRSLAVIGSTVVPEPSSLTLLAMGAVAIVGRRRRR